MSLCIRNKETCQLARELADLTGESMTEAITIALKERLEHEKRERNLESRVRELHAIGQRCARLLCDGPSSVAHGDFLFDEDGLPK